MIKCGICHGSVININIFKYMHIIWKICVTFVCIFIFYRDVELHQQTTNELIIYVI